ncbi:MAG: two pore domain potassium channel family protein [Cyclobacteriaceae bacterium]|nr:two pore domain potassium channel family protein [Cyclobacteriaceae bacterium]
MQLQRIKDYWPAIVLAEIFTLIFITGFFPQHWLPVVGPVLYSLLYLTTALVLERNRSMMIRVGAALLVAQGIFKIVDWPVIEALSKGLNIIFFVIIVSMFIYQIASAREVTGRVILEAINGYLLLGLVFSFLISLMLQFDPDAFNFPNKPTLLDSLYYVFVTLTTLGYGDLLPVAPHAKSLSMLIAVSGQLYIAIIIALLVGKFSSKR